VKGRTESLARQFDRVLRVLESWGYVEGWSLTPAGERLARLYHEADLLVAECLETGALDGLGPAELAALVSVFVYEARGQAEPVAWWPTARLRQRWPMIGTIATELNRAEDAAGLPLTRQPDMGFAAFAYRWADGDDLTRVIGDEGVSGGDFVRNVKQLIDLLRQLGDHAPDAATAATARRAADALFRGVVAASSVVGTVAPVVHP
jgi:ATP-dependent RNA helicase HelY